MQKVRQKKGKILSEKDYLKYLISKSVPICIRKSDGTDLENVTLVDFDAGDKKHIVYRREGDQLSIIPKLECVFIAKMKDHQCVTQRRRKDTMDTPRYLRKSKQGEDRWAFPQHKVLNKMKNGDIGIFALTDGFMYAGPVYWYSQWNIFLSVARGKEILLFKHACKRWKVVTPKSKKVKLDSDNTPTSKITSEVEALKI